MNGLIDPNVAYVLLVAGFLLATLALFAPGTGILELGAVAALIFAGYLASNLPINWWALAVLILGVFPFLLALRRSRNSAYLVVSLVALIIGSAYLFNSGEWWLPGVNPLLAVVVSGLATALLWIAGTKTLEASFRKPKHLNDLVGAIGEAKTPVHGEGSVYVAGENWSAHSANPIPAEARVRVIRKDGLMLEVEQVDTKDGQSPSA